jgi:nicotinate-nucleotide--dimethylbenzimidazole phosphoribosyltransferase
MSLSDVHAAWRGHPRFADAERAINAKTKPHGSLGRLEALAIQLACLQDTLTPDVDDARVLVFAADHGIADDAVSAYPKAVTAQMVQNFASGGAAICVLARSVGAELEVLDVGVDADLSHVSGVVHASVRRGTRNMRHADAMTGGECVQAMDVGRAAVDRAVRDGVQVIVLGEMGIGNTTAAAALTSVFAQAPAAQTVGRGTGIDDAQWARKVAIVEEVLASRNPDSTAPLATLRAMGGLEIAAMTGAVLAAAAHNLVVIVDGYIATAAVLVADRIDSGIRRACIFAHRGAEPGHRIALDALDAHPLLALDLRLGEGSGAALALPLVRAAACILREMATFEDAGVSEATAS